MNFNEKSQFLTKKEAAALLNCGVRSVDKWRQVEKLPCVRIKNFVRFEREKLLEWMQKYQEIKGQNQNAEQRQEGGA